MIDPDPGFNPVPGQCDRLAPGLRRVLAPNPSPMTFRGTNSFLLGQGAVAVIDPGPALPGHVAALMAALEPGERIVAILVTHSHLDHSPAAPLLAARCGAPVLGFGPSDAGRSGVMQALVAAGMTGGGEGVDPDFTPDIRLADGETFRFGDEQLAVLHTPGHFGNHLCFLWRSRMFTGDHVMGWASSLVSPPDGDLGDYMRSLDRIESCAPEVLYPAHGDAVHDPAARIGWLRSHRQSREAQILAALGPVPASAAELAARIYHDTPPALLPAAERNVLAHLLDLASRGLARAEGPPGTQTGFTTA